MGSLRMELRQEIKQEQRLELSMDYAIVSQTACPFCGNIVEPIQKNWINSETDCRMVCNVCRKRFQGLLQIFDKEGIDVGTYHFLCLPQVTYTINQIKENGRKKLGQKFLHDNHPEIYFSLIKHFGSYRKGIKKLSHVK